MDTYKDRLEASMLRANVTKTKLAEALGVSYQSVKKIFDGKSYAFKAENNAIAAAYLKVNSDWLATGKGQMEIAAPYESISILPDGRKAHTLIAPDDAVPIKRLLNSAAMGGGEEVLDEDVVLGEILVSSQFIKTQIRPTSNDRLCFIHAYGDSMEPTFRSGDVLLVDTGYTEAKIDGIYVLRAHDRLFVKRLRQRMDGKFEISSDNPTHKTVDLLNGDSEVQVRGRVVWCWNGRRL